MPRIVADKYCQQELIRRAKASISPTAELDKIPTKHEQLRPRLTEHVCNVAYYEWFMQKQPTLEYETTAGKLFYADNTLVYVNANEEYPVKGLYQVEPSTFLNTPSCRDVDLWGLPKASIIIDEKIFVDKFNTISMVSPLSEILRDFSYSTIQHAFNRSYVYVTTENGTTRLQSMADLVISQIWGTDPIFESRYVSVSKLDLL